MAKTIRIKKKCMSDEIVCNVVAKNCRYWLISLNLTEEKSNSPLISRQNILASSQDKTRGF